MNNLHQPIDKPADKSVDKSVDKSGDGLHRHLAYFNAQRLKPCGPAGRTPANLHEQRLTLALQEDFVERERAKVTEIARAVPSDQAGFIAWFTDLREHGEGQNDPLFPWLAEEGTIEDMRWFLTQEAAGEAGFDDLVALTQVKMPTRPKLEMARNYWDEMGRGQEAGMHGGLLERVSRFLDLPIAIDSTVWPSLALSNLMIALATERHYAYHSIGALGVIEMTAPGRVAAVAAGLRRLGVPAPERLYFDLHATLDLKHSLAWNSEVIAPLIELYPRVAPWIAEGALMRLNAGARCFRRYRAQLRVGVATSDGVTVDR